MNKVFALFVAIAQAGVIVQLDRSVVVTDTEITMTTADIKFKLDADENELLYTVPADFEHTLVSLEVIDALRGESATLPIQKIHGTNDTILWYSIDIQEAVQRSKDKSVYIQVVEIHKRRREPYPAEAAITEGQTFQIHESAVLLSPYKVQK